MLVCLSIFLSLSEHTHKQRAAGEANDRLASQMVFSLRGIMGSPATTARLRLKAGKADPANPLSKFLMVLCKHPRGCAKVGFRTDKYVRGRGGGLDFECHAFSQAGFFEG